MLIKSNGKIAVYLENSTPNYDGTGTHTLATGTWYYLTYTYDGSSLIGYVNGEQDASVSGSMPTTLQPATQWLGNSNFSGRLLNGKMDEVRFASVPRSPGWIATEYNNQSSPSTFSSIGGENASDIMLSLAPTAGAPESSVTISGQGFGASTGTVTFSGQAATVTSWSNTSIVALVPDGAISGAVVVTSATGPSNAIGFSVLPPVITALTPASAEPTTSITVTGTNLGPNQGTVSINGQSASINSWSDTSIAVVVPASANSGNVVVSNRGLQSAGTPFTVLLPTIGSLSPNAGDPGTSVVIAGSAFGSAQGSVTFNGVTAVVTSWNDTSITAQAPVGAGSGNVVATSAVARPSNGVGFNMTDNLAVTLFAPLTGPTGTSVTVTGRGFGATQGSSVVRFNGRELSG